MKKKKCLRVFVSISAALMILFGFFVYTFPPSHWNYRYTTLLNAIVTRIRVQFENRYIILTENPMQYITPKPRPFEDLYNGNIEEYILDIYHDFDFDSASFEMGKYLKDYIGVREGELYAHDTYVFLGRLVIIEKKLDIQKTSLDIEELEKIIEEVHLETFDFYSYEQ